MDNDLLDGAIKIPDESMGYIRKLAVRAVVELHYPPDRVANMFGIPQRSLVEWINRYECGGYDLLDTCAAPDGTPSDAIPPAAPRLVKKYAGTGRNEPCPCGSGRKYKKCCGASNTFVA